MFVAAVAMREPIPATRWAGAAIAFAGLLVLLLPGVQGGADDALALALMLAAAIGWAGYTLAGRKATDALQATAANFLLSVPVVLAAVLLVPAGIATATATTPTGLALALVSGGVTSGLGYALWFRVLPRLDRTIAAVAQLTAPVIAAAGGIALIGERPGWDFALATLLVLGGVLLSLRKPAT